MMAVAMLAATSSSLSTAEESDWYVGASAGQSRASIDNARIIDGLSESGITTSAIRDDDRHFAYKVFGGFEFDKYFALEAGYFDLGRFGYSATTVPATALTGRIKLNGANLDAVGKLPLLAGLSVFARLGYTYSYAKDDFAGAGAVIVQDGERSMGASNYKFGVGLQYAVTESLGLRAEAERYRIDDAVGNRGDVDLFSGGFVYRFGRAAPPMVRSVAIEPQVSPEPASAPKAPPPPPPIQRKVRFSADSLFAFGQDTVQPRGRQSLQDFGTELKGAQFDLITVTGYSDRIGSHEYNFKLSARRAQAVKTYLVEALGIAENKIFARGADGSDPVTHPDQCKGQQRTARLISCLQPDRRVEVEVTGTRLRLQP
jgi:OOP family OmpA-OmpF porin